MEFLNLIVSSNGQKAKNCEKYVKQLPTLYLEQLPVDDDLKNI